MVLSLSLPPSLILHSLNLSPPLCLPLSLPPSLSLSLWPPPPPPQGEGRHSRW